MNSTIDMTKTHGLSDEQSESADIVGEKLAEMLKAGKLSKIQIRELKRLSKGASQGYSSALIEYFHFLTTLGLSVPADIIDEMFVDYCKAGALDKLMEMYKAGQLFTIQERTVEQLIEKNDYSKTEKIELMLIMSKLKLFSVKV